MSFTGKLNAQQVHDLIVPLKVIGTLVGDYGLYIDIFTDEDGNMKYLIPARNKSRGILMIHEWTNLFKDFTIDEDTKLALMEPNDLINKMNIFEPDSSLEVNLSDANELSLKQNLSTLTYRLTDPELIEGSPRAFAGAPVQSSFHYDDKMKTFSKAMAAMGKEECILFESSVVDQEVTITIRNKQLCHNNFQVKIPAIVKEDNVAMYKKDLLQLILASKLGNMKINISDRFVNIECKKDNSVTNFYVSKVAKFTG